MRPVYVAADNIISPLGYTTAANMEQLKLRSTGIKQHSVSEYSTVPFYASLFSTDVFNENGTYTKFEQLLIASIKDALEHCNIKPDDERTVLIVSTTKGNVSLLETQPERPDLKERIALHTSSKLVAEHFEFKSQAIVVSNACISGIMAILTGLRLIQSGQFDNAIVVGADVITKFVLSGFQSFQAVSAEPCKPFDVDRTGITLGEGAATIVLTSNPLYNTQIQVLSGAVSNDGNHISAPSRTGEELSQAISSSLIDAGLNAADIDFISAHGTATSYNDEMEAKAIALAGLSNVPANSLKGFYGHTLGAAGLIESVISMQSLKENIILPTPGHSSLGVSSPINIVTSLMQHSVKTFLKTASGFGGCNGAVIFSK
ncbi:beta-ketoacyl-[acyl-carrier-protein] synthase family protein [Mucilaginibacter auburnensis]|uniref:3-oxoacyl-[acyl-carrier-protein] synthase-1 n=1 Tax=Mucilaginibacter auburnensis TaxID=1457233 RepID=A0A2H9VW32_9SPHI|nr:beta-ketoacyl synthase N-terminal-like domain-containing protein [Mucilaginibacter auburnensis]PJJ84992.1 3-oxoacyl-[acyl-carrier-protein] synthase-1 [Mucilaginibacter auburnensis]